MIKISNLSKEYVKGIKALDHINLEIKDGEIFGFIGPNGSGKSTTINILTGIIDKDEGHVTFDDKSIDDNHYEIKKKIGYVSDNPEIFLKLKAIEFLNFVADIYQVSINDRKERIEKYATTFEINKDLNKLIGDLSHGMRQKVFVIAALLHQPDFWILDEPLTGLDPKASFALKEMMREHARSNHTVFFSTHVLDVAEKLCDRVAIINKGKIITVGGIEEIRAKYGSDLSLEQLFLTITNG